LTSKPASSSTASSVSALSSHSLQYQLYGVVVHAGVLSGGHYVAYVYSKHHSQRFYVSDSSVMKAYAKEVLSCEAYILFYERVQQEQNTEKA